MNADELLKRIAAYGADLSGINDRFMGNLELYESCLLELLEEPSFLLLKQSVDAKDYQKAFSCAHALKGLSGNLGLTPFYDAVCRLVESLRAKQYAALDAEYAEVEKQYLRLKTLLSGEAPLERPAQAEKSEARAVLPARLSESADDGESKTRDPLVRSLVSTLLVAIVCLALLFFRVYGNYRDNITKESAEHLAEICYQIKLYTEERVESDWKIAHSVSDSIKNNAGTLSDDSDVYGLMQRKRDIWGITDIVLYTEGGYAICSDGDVTPNDVASETIYYAREQGEYLSIVDSELTYTVPVETELRYNGSRIAAVSVVQSMEHFLDNMNFSSFDGQAWLYLTDAQGVVISRLTNPRSLPAYNITAVASERNLEALDADPSAELLHVTEPTAFLIDGDAEREYIVSAPITTRSTPLRLFYFAPVSVINETMNGFSRQLITLSGVFILVFALFAFFLFQLVISMRKKQFNEKLLARERMFGLLVENTKTAFGLFTAGRSMPVYSSANAPSIIGDQYYTLEKNGGVFSMHGTESEDSGPLLTLNERLRNWDGETEFKSGYLCNDRAVPPNYFEVELYPAGGGEGDDYIGIAQDKTQAFERENATRIALDMADRANEAKSRFLSNMSHDIRTPMNAIVNMTDFALESMHRPKQLGMYLQTIRDSSQHLLRLINDVLDMSRIESGQTVIESKPFDIKAEFERQAEMIRPLCKAKDMVLITDFSALRTTAVCGDAVKVSQIVANLLSNAVKFTRKNGAVRFTAIELPSLREELADIRITVEDNGIGIPHAYLAHIFDPFTRADDRRVSKIEGTGLGLSICRSYVSAMGGTIRCESEEGEGSVFTVELYFPKADNVPAEEHDAALLGEKPFIGLRCLVCEDNGVNQIIAKAMLERIGFIVDTAENGMEGLRKFTRSKPGAYAVIYMDIQMPVMDGYQATVSIRESSHADARTVPIVAMTANVFAEDVEKARIAGMDGHLGKPIMSIKLIEETYKVLQHGKDGQV